MTPQCYALKDVGGAARLMMPASAQHSEAMWLACRCRIQKCATQLAHLACAEPPDFRGCAGWLHTGEVTRAGGPYARMRNTTDACCRRRVTSWALWCTAMRFSAVALNWGGKHLKVANKEGLHLLSCLVAVPIVFKILGRILACTAITLLLTM